MENNEEKNSLDEENALLKAYKTLEANSVPREQYEKEVKELKEKNKLYLNAITEGSNVPVDDESNNRSLEDKILELSKFKGTNLDFWDKMCDALDDTLKKVPQSEIIKVMGTEGLEELIEVNEGMRAMVNDANGDPDIFRTLYKARVQESSPKIASEIERHGGLVGYLTATQK